jgi:hypothetical protein
MKIRTNIVNGDIVEIKPYIFAVVIKDNYDRSMLFCRYQEYYESPFTEIRGKFFTLEEYMKIYIKNNKEKTFTYPNDWAGYNVPSNILIDARKKFASSVNMYDLIMNDIIEFCEKESKFRNFNEKHPWYLIGVDKLKSQILNHEIAHGLYYTDLKYKVEMDYHTTNITKTDLKSLKNKLIKMGYVNDDKILNDEIQAHMATGKFPTWNDLTYKKYMNEYIETFKKHNI